MNKKGTSILVILVITLLSLPIVFSSVSIKVVYAQAGQVSLTPTDDTYVDSHDPNSNHGGEAALYVENAGINIQELVWLKFDLSSVPNGAVVDIASIQLYAYYVGGTFNISDYFCSANSWTELSLRYADMPSFNTTSMDSFLVTSSNQWYNWSAIDAVRNALNVNPKSVTIVLQEPTPQSSGTYVEFESKEGLTGYSPKLTVHWSSVVPEFPTFLILPLFMTTTLLAVMVYKKKAMLYKRL